MPTPELAKHADTVRADIARLEADLKALFDTIGGAIGAAVSRRVNEPMRNVSAYINPLLNMLATPGDVPVPFKRGPGRPKNAVGEAPKRRGRRGGRRTKSNLTPEAIQDALRQTGGNKSAAAKALGVSQPTFYKYLAASTATHAAMPRSPKTAEKRTSAPSKSSAKKR